MTLEKPKTLQGKAQGRYTREGGDGGEHTHTQSTMSNCGEEKWWLADFAWDHAAPLLTTHQPTTTDRLLW